MCAILMSVSGGYWMKMVSFCHSHAVRIVSDAMMSSSSDEETVHLCTRSDVLSPSALQAAFTVLSATRRRHMDSNRSN